MRSTTALLALLLTLPCACTSAKSEEPRLELAPGQVPQPPRPWTQAFQGEAVLVADRIEIEGPHELVDHVVLVQDEETTRYQAETTTRGFVQVLSARPELGVEVRGQLDGWTLAAFGEIRVLQRPGDVPVTVRATGNAYWAAADGSGEQRDQQLTFRGLPGQ